jgi:hypothetical protein
VNFPSVTLFVCLSLVCDEGWIRLEFVVPAKARKDTEFFGDTSGDIGGGPDFIPRILN